MEYALIAPALFSIIFGMVDYGWYFWRQAEAADVVQVAVRAAALQPPHEYDDFGMCTPCVERLVDEIGTELQNRNFEISASEIHPIIENRAGRCVLAVYLSIPSGTLVGLLPSPDAHTFQSSAYLQGVTEC